MVEVENEASRREEVKLLNNSIETIKRDKALIESHFAKSSDVVPFLDTIEALGPKVGVKAETTSVDISKDNTALVVQIKATGDFKNIYRFLTLLENSPYELEFTSVDIQKGGESGVDEQGIPFSNAGWEATFGIKLLSFIQ